MKLCLKGTLQECCHHIFVFFYISNSSNKLLENNIITFLWMVYFTLFNMQERVGKETYRGLQGAKKADAVIREFSPLNKRLCILWYHGKITLHATRNFSVHVFGITVSGWHYHSYCSSFPWRSNVAARERSHTRSKMFTLSSEHAERKWVKEGSPVSVATTHYFKANVRCLFSRSLLWWFVNRGECQFFCLS